jgi:DNA-binding NtrC family response regulator
MTVEKTLTRFHDVNIAWCADCSSSATEATMRPLTNPSETVLIVSDDATGAALLGALVETLGYRVMFTKVLGSADGLRRVRPSVCMLDCESDACDEATVARTLMRGVSVVLVGPRELLQQMRDVAARHSVDIVFTPAEPGALGDVLGRATRRAQL